MELEFGVLVLVDQGKPEKLEKKSRFQFQIEPINCGHFSILQTNKSINKQINFKIILSGKDY